MLLFQSSAHQSFGKVCILMKPKYLYSLLVLAQTLFFITALLLTLRVRISVCRQ